MDVYLGRQTQQQRLGMGFAGDGSGGLNFGRRALGLVFHFHSLSPPGSLVRSTEETRVAPNIGWNQYSIGIRSRGRTNEVAV
jgi:hypothetical protein